MARVNISIDTSVGKSADFNVDDGLMSYRYFDSQTRELLDDAYRQACDWLATLKPQDPAGES